MGGNVRMGLGHLESVKEVHGIIGWERITVEVAN
jgi:hypothetical protein